jgi:hypothetical protein
MFLWRGVTIEIIDIECVLLSFLSKNFVSTKWRIYKGFWLVPDSCGKEFHAVAGSANCFFSTKFAKTIISRLKVEKKFFKEVRVSKNPFQWFFYENK